jgi:uncharacterized protein YaiI (UPF0178 family)
MKILVDADSCPSQVRNIIARAAERTGTRALFVANRKIPFSPKTEARMIVVREGEISDDRLVGLAEAGDLAVTRDIPLAERLLNRGVRPINDRGGIFTPDMIRERISLRDFMEDLRKSGRPIPEEDRFGDREARAFAARLDAELHKLSKEDD